MTINMFWFHSAILLFAFYSFPLLFVLLFSLSCVGEDSWESLRLQRDPTSPFWRRSALGVLWKEWCQSWNSSTLATSCEELTHWKRLWCWEGLGAGDEGDDWGWDGWMASRTRWTRVWVNSGSWWWTGRPGMLRFMGSQRVGHDWATELNWTDTGINPIESWCLTLFICCWISILLSFASTLMRELGLQFSVLVISCFLILQDNIE